MKHMKQLPQRLSIFTLGLLVMALGIVLIIVADCGASPWDVLHVGLYYQFGLTIGTWSIIVGVVILATSSIMLKQWPQFGAYLNMLLVGIFIDMYLMISFLVEPNSMIGKLTMFIIGVFIYAYGMGIYLSSQLGAGPRDSLMLALNKLTKWKVSSIRWIMEVIVLIIGWVLGGPVFIGTIVFFLLIGPVVGFALPQCQKNTNKLLNKIEQKNIGKQIGRGASL